MNELFESLKDLVLSDRGEAIVRALILVLVGLVVSRLAAMSATRLLRGRIGPQGVSLTRRLVGYGVLALFVLTALTEAGFDLSILLGAAGVLTVALGFASQTSVSNLISGLFLIGERALEIGETVTIGDTTGEVLSVDLLSVKLRTFDNLLVRLPNETVLKAKIVNLSRFPIRRLDQALSVAYGTDLEKVRGILMKLASDNPLCLDEPKPILFHRGFGDSAILLQFSVWFLTPKLLELRNQLPEQISLAFAEAGIEIPFPQRTITVRGADLPVVGGGAEVEPVDEEPPA